VKFLKQQSHDIVMLMVQHYSSYADILLPLTREFWQMNPTNPQKNIFSQMLLKYQRILTTLCNWSAISATYRDCWEWFLQSRLSPQVFPLPQHLCCSNAVLFLFVTYKYSIMVLIVFTIYICQKVCFFKSASWKSPALKKIFQKCLVLA